MRSRARLSKAWILWQQTPRQPLLGASRPGIDLLIVFVLPPGIIGWGFADILGAEGRSLVDRLFGVLLLNGGFLLSYVTWGYLHRPVQRTSDQEGLHALTDRVFRRTSLRARKAADGGGVAGHS